MTRFCGRGIGRRYVGDSGTVDFADFIGWVYARVKGKKE